MNVIDEIAPDDRMEVMPHDQTGTSRNRAQTNWSQIVDNKSRHRSFSVDESNRIVDDSQGVDNRRGIQIIGRQCRGRNDGSRATMPFMNSSKNPHSLQLKIGKVQTNNRH